jgi:hypothetical protein
VAAGRETTRSDLKGLMGKSPNAVFYEVQHLRQQLVMVITLPSGLFLIGFFVYAMVQQLIHGRPFGDNPMPDGVLAVMGPLYILLGILLLWLYFGGKLVTEVRPDGLFVRFFPLHRRTQHIRTDEIESCEVMTYRPIRDFGGWGIRRGPKGRAYNVFGNRGAYLTFRDGKRLLVGSQKPQMLVDAIKAIR